MSDRAPAGQFLDAAIDLLRRVRDEEADSITAAGTLLADTVESGGRLFAFGADPPPSPRRTSSTAPAVSPS